MNNDSKGTGILKILHLGEYGFSVLVVGVATALSFAMFPFFELTNLVMIYLLGVLIVAVRGHRTSAALASILSVLAFDFCFVPLRFKFSVTDVQYVWTFIIMLIVAMIISHLTIRLRSEAEAARQGQKKTAMMHAFTQHLASTRGLEKVLHASVRHIGEVFNSAVTAFMPNQEGHLIPRASFGSPIKINEKEIGVAQWVYDRWQSAGLGTQSLPGEGALYVPIQGSEGTLGVLRVEPKTEANLADPEKKLLLDSFTHQIGLVLEVDRLEENAKKAEMEAEKEYLRSSLLSTVSHDFRTPLAAILGSTGALLKKEEVRKNPFMQELLDNIQTEAKRLSRLVQNLLEATRLESGVHIQKELFPLEEIIGNALDRLKELGERQVIVEIPENLPAIPMDGSLMEQVFINLLENAFRYTTLDHLIKVDAKDENGAILVTISNQGTVLKEEELERIFDKFYRDPSSPGAGLGLAICRAIVHTHGGKIWAEKKEGWGATFHFTLPLDKNDGF